jgi:TonB family protein
MKITTFLGRIFYPAILRFIALSLITLGWSTPAFCGPTYASAQAGDPEKGAALLKDEAELDSYLLKFGTASLREAVRFGRKNVVELLLAKGSDVSAKDTAGWTPLHEAALRGYQDIAELLLARGAAVNAKNGNGYTSLHLAAEGGYKDMVEMLLAKGADINAKNKKGYTPLHMAAIHDRKDIAESLLANKADVNIPNEYGYTPLDIAGSTDVSELLRQRGGSIGTSRNTGIGAGAEKPIEPGMLLGMGMIQPKVLSQPLPPYTEEARRARIEGIVLLLAIIRKDGTIDNFKVIKRLGYGLDDSAVDTIASKWRFDPGQKNGVPVDVFANIEVRFRIF